MAKLTADQNGNPIVKDPRCACSELELFFMSHNSTCPVHGNNVIQLGRTSKERAVQRFREISRVHGEEEAITRMNSKELSLVQEFADQLDEF
jgi:hypothetical protein